MVILTEPVVPDATIAVMVFTFVSVKEVAGVPPKLTAVAPDKKVPVMVTLVPVAAPAGVNEVMVGVITPVPILTVVVLLPMELVPVIVYRVIPVVVVGVPLMMPVEGSILKPAGNAGLMIYPESSICLILYPKYSATYSLPELMTKLNGNLKLAAAPMPSAELGLPLPANVVTIPAGVILRIFEPIASAI